MGRRSRAQKIIDNIDDKLESDFQHLVVYDFRVKEANNRFWNNLRVITGVLGGEMLQYSVYFGPIKGALAVCKLVEAYEGEAWMFAVLRNFGGTYTRNY